MKGSKLLSNKKTLVFIIFCIFTVFTLPVNAEEICFNQEELEYLNKTNVIKAVSIDGAAPLHYKDSKGTIRGIAVSVLNEIADLTGLVFEYHLYDSINDAVTDSSADIIFGVTEKYAPPGIILSIPYLKSEAILFYNSSLEVNQLNDKRFAAIKGGTLPKGIKEETTIYYYNREDTLNAVEKGQTDYGYGNAYSLAFYTLQNGYKNIITIPTSKEDRAYCIGLPEKHGILLSIINKSIAAIDENRIQTLVLDVASQVERKITFSMIMDAYGREISGMILLVMLALLYGVFSNIRANNQLKLQNKRYELLSHVSNELLFEYYIKSGHLKISEKFGQIVDIARKKDDVTDMLKYALSTLVNKDVSEAVSAINLPLADGNIGVFKVISLSLYDEHGQLYSIIGKLTDISKEQAEKERLISKSQLDGLTGLYNATTTRELIAKSLINKPENIKDALMIIDCDNFKNINDTVGHLKGDLALKNISQGLLLTFRKSDIVGRIGGDEFCIYMHNVPSADFVRSKCRKLNDIIQEINQEFPVAISIGITIWSKDSSYEKLFKQADDALYIAKRNGGAQAVIYGEKKYLATGTGAGVL